MNAKEAKETAHAVNVSENNGTLSRIREAIESAAKKGEYSVTFSGYLNNDLKTALTGEGFKYEQFSDQREPASVTISWA